MLDTLEYSRQASSIDQSFHEEVRRGLSSKQKKISSKFLYDARGSELFVKITRLDQYYLSRCEAEILCEQAPDICELLGDNIGEVIELGCGDGHKTQTLLSALTKRFDNFRFTPVDICEDSTRQIKQRINQVLPDIHVQPWHGDYHSFLKTPSPVKSGQQQLVLFLGSNIGNFTRDEALAFLRAINRFCRPGDFFLLGLDLKKDIRLLHEAYNDEEGITREFNFNLLRRINRELGADFDPGRFYHHGVYNALQGAMQSFLIAKVAHRVKLRALDLEVDFDSFEAIHIEDSHKYSRRDAENLARAAGFQVKGCFSDSRAYFMDVLLQKVEQKP